MKKSLMHILQFFGIIATPEYFIKQNNLIAKNLNGHHSRLYHRYTTDAVESMFKQIVDSPDSKFPILHTDHDRTAFSYSSAADHVVYMKDNAESSTIGFGTNPQILDGDLYVDIHLNRAALIRHFGECELSTEDVFKKLFICVCSSGVKMPFYSGTAFISADLLYLDAIYWDQN